MPEIPNDTADYFKGPKKSVSKMLSGVTESHQVDIEFEDLTFNVKHGIKFGTKTILNGVSGRFCSGELTAILGPSGSGKSTLLNILAGYGPRRTAGVIKINNKSQKYKTFRKLAAYIMQDVVLQPLLTVKEAMVVSAQLKLGSHISLNEKLVIVDEILTVLGLKNCCDTMAEQLSGGETRRLSIALELVNNPPVLLLDEPTSGLDTVAMMQCLETLKVLSKQGRTIICSIHQPSASSFMQFEKVYFMANGMCVYNGSPDKTLSYLSSLGLPCPTTYSPAEYIIELVQVNEEYISTMVEHCHNGKTDHCLRQPSSIKLGNGNSEHRVYQETTEIVSELDYPTSFWTQFTVLLQRMMLQQRRNKTSIGIQILHHLLCSFLYGSLFYGIGNNASTSYNVFGFSACVMVFFVFTYIMTPILLFPAEVKLLKREYFNRWYRLKAYYLAMSLRNLPLMITLGLVFLVISYFMTCQPMELLRFVLFATGAILIAMASEGIGLTIGSLFNITNGAIVGSAVAAPMVILSVYGIGYVYNDIVLPVRIAMSLSYLRFGTSAMVVALLEDRDVFECFEIFCAFRSVKYLTRILGMDDMTYVSRILPLIGFTICFKVLAFLALKYRLNPKLSVTFIGFVHNLVKSR